MAKEDTTKKPVEKPAAVGEFSAGKIMTQPLPQILDEIEGSIKIANEAAADARKAAEEARRAGEKAAGEAARVAAEAISRVERVARESLTLARLINSALIEAAAGIEKKLGGK